MDITMHPVESSSLAAIGYDKASRVLHVEFRSGRRYEYTGVSPYRYRKLRGAESKGRYFNAHIRRGYAYSEV